MPTLTISTIQTLLHWESKAANLQMLEEKINSLFQKTGSRGAAGNVQHGVYHETRIVCRNNGRPHSGMDEKAERFKSGNLNR